MTLSKASLTKSEKKSKSSIGAPSQRAQSTRKGKKAWRKNVDLDEVEEGLEELRTEERITGSVLHVKSNDELFQVDVKGDDQVRKRLPKFSSSQLTSLRVLSQRSAVPAVFSRPTSSTTPKRTRLTHEEKGRLLRIGKRMRKGPFDAVIDPTEVGAGSALLEVSEAVKESGTYDVWSGHKVEEAAEEVVKNALGKKIQIKAPKTPHPRKHISLSAVPAPHEGTSYNPPVGSHQSLLRAAHENEERKVKRAEELQELKQKIEEGRKVGDDSGNTVMGMAVDISSKEAVDREGEGDEIRLTKKMPERKTKQERVKAAKRRAEKRAIAEALAKKRMLTQIYAAKSLRKSALKSAVSREQLQAQRQQATQEKLKSGLAGHRLGKHIVPEGEVDVQLGEDLSESLRGLKPEGNLFRDRFLNMQQRALVEPRVPVLPKRHRAKIKEYEKHPFKRFDREA